MHRFLTASQTSAQR